MKIKETKKSFIIIRVTEEEKRELIKKAIDSKNLSRYVRHILQLDDR
jgi:hypothetical protein